MARNRWLLPAAGLGAAVALRRRLRRARRADLQGQIALITGGSRGLGLALARELARHGCTIVLLARDADELSRAQQDVETRGAEVLTIPCDVTDRDQVRGALGRALEHLGRIDILVNNAGVMSVGPLETHTTEDFERALDVMFWGAVYPTLELLPHMRSRGAGHIVNITSIGGKLSVPHLLPYSAAKFAAVGFSEGLHAELAPTGINVLTVVPGLMRTGSHVNAEFKGQHRKEFAWFSLAASLPITSIAADDAARQIVAAMVNRDAEIILTWQAALAARMHGLLPGLTVDVLSVVNRLLPAAPANAKTGAQAQPGHASRTTLSDSPLTTLGTRAADDLNQR